MSNPLSNGSVVDRQLRGMLPSVGALQQFIDHLFDKNVMPIDASPRLQLTMINGTEKALQKLWQLSETSAQEFADEVASFFALPRIGLADLMSATSLDEKFSARFLRESSAFPCTSKESGNRLVIADPTDSAVIRAAELVLGRPLEIAIASFEDIATVLA